MDFKALLKLASKLAVVGAVAAGTVAGGQYVAADSVNVSAVVTAAVTAIVAYLKQSPVGK
jgi:hypothetical protein